MRHWRLHRSAAELWEGAGGDGSGGGGRREGQRHTFTLQWTSWLADLTETRWWWSVHRAERQKNWMVSRCHGVVLRGRVSAARSGVFVWQQQRSTDREEPPLADSMILESTASKQQRWYLSSLWSAPCDVM